MKKQDIIAAHEANPTWCAAQLARHCGATRSYVRQVADDCKLRLAAGTVARRTSARLVMRMGWAAVNAGLTIADIEQAAQAKRASA